MQKMIKIIISTLLCVTATHVYSHDYHQGSMQIDHPWSREAPASAAVIAGYFKLTNSASSDDFLLHASSPIADKVEVHRHIMANGMMQMEKINNLRIGSFNSVMFAPGGLHLMIFNPTQNYQQGERFPMTLTFKNAGSIEVEMAVETGGHVHVH